MKSKAPDIASSWSIQFQYLQATCRCRSRRRCQVWNAVAEIKKAIDDLNFDLAAARSATVLVRSAMEDYPSDQCCESILSMPSAPRGPASASRPLVAKCIMRTAGISVWMHRSC